MRTLLITCIGKKGLQIVLDISVTIKLSMQVVVAKKNMTKLLNINLREEIEINI